MLQQQPTPAKASSNWAPQNVGSRSLLEQDTLSWVQPSSQAIPFPGEWGGTTTTDKTTKKAPVPVPGDPTLYQLPEGVYAEHRPLPSEAQLGVWLMSAFLSAASSLEKLQWAWIWPIAAMSTGRFPVVKTVGFVMKTLILAKMFTAVIQDTFLGPSRITTQQLMESYHLPSKFSRYEVLEPTPSDGAGCAAQGVHYLSCKASGPDRARKTGLVHLNHGFGASSLSWLPVMEPLVDQLDYRHVVAHDAPGFGFTDRPRDYLEAYTTRGSAEFGSSLLKQCLESDSESVLLCGHSWGSLTTLRMALELPDHIEKKIVLVNPALGVRPQKQPTEPKKQIPVNNWFQSLLVEPVGTFVLRHVVGRPGFWKAGLQLAWGDPEKLSDADVLRFQWPAIGHGWEKGVLAFARAQLIPMEQTDEELLTKVLSKPNTTVSVIYGEKDKVISPQTVQSFFQSFPSVELVQLDGLGHDPFEEDVGVFMSALKKVLSN